uniref:CSON001111 protein n=1 Tax=Culicoides sonorensis TaxID=179676 RepID=A0A336KXA0_CULSO
MMGLQVAASKRKYEIGACTDLSDIQPNCTPEKNPRLDDSHTITNLTETITTSNSSTSSSTSLTCSESTSTSITLNTSNTENSSNTLITVNSSETASITTHKPITNGEAVNSTKPRLPELTGRGHELTLAKLNTPSALNNNRPSIQNSWNNSTDDNETVIDPISKLQAVAVPDEAWGGVKITRSSLEAVFSPTDDLDEDIDDFEDDFDEDDLPINPAPPVCNMSAPPPSPPFTSSYNNPNNCSRIPNYRYGSWTYAYHPNEPMPISDPPQTIRCAENGKSYTELGTYTFFNSNTTRHIKRCCDGKNNWCNNKQCYKEKRLRMMNLSMFKLSRFRQASDQSLYRSVLICNTLKTIEKEIETEKRQMKRQQSLAQTNALIAAQQKQQQQQQSDYASRPHVVVGNNRYVIVGGNTTNDGSQIQSNTQQQQQQQQQQQKRNEYSENNPNSSNNVMQSYTNHNRMQPQNDFEDPPPPLQFYEYYMMKDPQSGRATPFPASNGYPDTDSGYGDTPENTDLSPDGQLKSINWGSVLSLSSQSALDPLNNNELFSSHTTNYNITSNSCSSSFNSSLSSTTTTNYLDTDLGYDVLPNCYKLTSFGSDDFLKTPLMDSSIVCYENDMPDAFSTHIMVGS